MLQLYDTFKMDENQSMLQFYDSFEMDEQRAGTFTAEARTEY